MEQPEQLERSEQVLALEVPCDRAAPGVIRGALGDVKAAEALRDDLVLIASELVTNAVIHSGGSEKDLVGVRVFVGPGRALISVDDPGLSGESARPARTSAEVASGWGLRIVEQLAVRWGAERRDGYRVWAELAVR